MLAGLRDVLTGRDLERRLAPVLAPDTRRALGVSVPTYDVGRPLWPDRDADSLRRQAMASPVVYACITARAKAVSAAQLRVYRDSGGGQREELPDHPLTVLLRRPNPTVSEAEFLLTTVMFTDVAGFALIEKVRAAAGNIVELWHLRPDWARPIARGDGAWDWEYRVPGRPPYRLAAEDAIVVTATPSLTLGATGISPTAVALREIGIEGSATDFLKLFFEHGAAPRYALTTPATITDQAKADLIRERWTQTYGGFGNWTQVALLHGGLDVKPIGYDLNEMAYADLRRFLEARICTTFGVPAILIGAQVGLDASTYSNFQEARRTFYEDTIGPLWARLDGVLTRSLLPELETDAAVSVEFDTSNIPALQDDVTPAWQRATSALMAGAITVNQAQMEMGLPGFGDAGEVLYLPASALPVRATDLGTLDAAAAAPAPAPAAQPVAPADAAATAGRSLPPSTLETRAAAAKNNRRRQAMLAIKLAPELRAFWREQGRRIAAAATRATPGHERRALEDIDWDAELAALERLLETHYTRAAASAYRAASDELGVALTFDAQRPGPRLLLETLGTRIVNIDETTRQDVARIVYEQTNAGTTPLKLADSIRGLFEETYRNRSLTVARTESQVALNTASTTAFRESGRVQYVQLFDNPEHDTEPGPDGLTCAQRDRLVVPVEDADTHIWAEHPNGSLAVSPVPLGPDLAGE